MSGTVRLHYGLIGDQIHFISEVANGLDCGCNCPNCGAQLVAKQGVQRAWHFAHYKAEECDLETAAETALHLAAKQILVQTKRLRLPPETVVVHLVDLARTPYRASEEIPGALVAFDQVDAEAAVSKYRADVWARTGNKDLMIEIRVSHAVDIEKRRGLKQLGVSCVEINLSNVDRDISLVELEKLLHSKDLPALWIFNARAELVRKRILAELQQKVDAINEQIKEHRLQVAAREKKAQERRSKRADAVERQWQIFCRYDDENILPDTDGSFKMAESISRLVARELHLDRNSLPDFVGLEIPGNRAFAGEPWVWQGRIFLQWLRCPTPEEAIGKTFRAMFIKEWAMRKLAIPACIKHLNLNLQILTFEAQQCVPDIYNAVRDYCAELSFLGYLEPTGGDSYRVANNDIESTEPQ